MRIGQRRTAAVMREHGFALQHLEPGEPVRRHRQARRAARLKRQPVEQNAGSRDTFLGEQALARGTVLRRLGGDRAFVEDCSHGTPGNLTLSFSHYGE